MSVRILRGWQGFCWSLVYLKSFLNLGGAGKNNCFDFIMFPSCFCLFQEIGLRIVFGLLDTAELLDAFLVSAVSSVNSSGSEALGGGEGGGVEAGGIFRWIIMM